MSFAHWRSPQPSGGNRYDDELIAGLPAAGVDLRVRAVKGAWPLPTDSERRALPQLLATGDEWLIDNIVGSAAPEAIIDAVEGRRVTLLMHYFPADDPSLSQEDRANLGASEALAVRAASRLVVPSAWAAAEVAARYGRDDAVVARPGVVTGPWPGSSAATPSLLWLSRLTPGKDPMTFIESLAHLPDLGWTARLVGPDDVDPTFTRLVVARIAELGLAGRVSVTGARTGPALEAVWTGTDLLIHTSRAEMYGMVVAEAAARGIPSVVSGGTGAVEAQTSGAQFSPGDSVGLAAELRSWLTNADLRRRWSAEALVRRAGIQTWSDTVATVAAALRG
ncbi:glycosyltransferase family 4 protein [Tessaracoccus sp. MC1756]|nr:glycosyltransferase family 4 protein [Tessaracoccus sp. MC1756]